MPWKSTKQLRNKFKLEERRHGDLIRLALHPKLCRPIKFDRFIKKLDERDNILSDGMILPISENLEDEKPKILIVEDSSPPQSNIRSLRNRKHVNYSE